jgi:hypothetical protein
MQALDLVNRPLQRQLRALAVALRAGSAERAHAHADCAVALINEATDLSLEADDLLAALTEGARSSRPGGEVIDILLEAGVRRRLEACGALVSDGGRARFTRDAGELRREVRRLLGAGGSPVDSDPRWRALLDES